MNIIIDLLSKCSFFTFFYGVITITFFSCATITTTNTGEVGLVNKKSIAKIKEIFSSEDHNKFFYIKDPAQFEKNMPISNLILNSTIIFDKDYLKITLFDGIKDFIIKNDDIIVLKANNAVASIETCPYLELEAIAEEAHLSEQYLVINYPDCFFIYDLENCEGIKKIPNNKREKITFTYPYYVLYDNRSFKLFSIHSEDPVLTGTFLNDIISLYIRDNFILVIDTVSQLTFIDIDEKMFRNIVKLNDSFQIAKLVDNTIYGITKDNVFAVVKFDEIDEGNYNVHHLLERSLKTFESCIIGEQLPSALCDGMLIVANNTININQQFAKFYEKDNIIYGLYGDSIMAYLIDKKYYSKKIVFNKSMFKPCLYEGSLHFLDIDNKIKKMEINLSISEKTLLTIVDKMPDKCDNSTVYYKEGYFINKGEPLLMIAKPVAIGETHIMVKRKIDETIYYFFEEIKH